MADIFVRSPGAGLLNGSSWPNAYASLVALSAAGGINPGDRVFVAHDHSEANDGNVTVIFPETGLPVLILCVDDSVASSNYTVASTPAPSTLKNTPTALVHNTSGFYNLRGDIYMHGFELRAADIIGFCPAGNNDQMLRHCLLNATTGRFDAGSSQNENNQHLFMQDVVHHTADGTGGAFEINGDNLTLDWVGGAFTWTGTQPTYAIRQSFTSQVAGRYNFRSVDFSQFTTAITVAGGWGSAAKWSFTKCKTHSGTPIFDLFHVDDFDEPGAEIEVKSCGPTGGDTFQYLYRDTYAVTEAVSAVSRVGGASDGTDSFCLSSRALPSTNISMARPHRFKICDLWWDGSSKIRIYVAQKNGQTRFKDNQFWIETEFARSGECHGKVQHSRADEFWVMSNGTDLTTDNGSSWSGLTTPVKSYVEITPTGGQAGPMTIWGFLAVDNSAANAELYIDPQVELVP